MKTWHTAVIVVGFVTSWSALLMSAQSSRAAAEFTTVRASEFVLTDAKGMRVGTMAVRDGATVFELCSPGANGQAGVVIACGDKGVEIKIGRTGVDALVQIDSHPKDAALRMYVQEPFGNSPRASLEANQQSGRLALDQSIAVEVDGVPSPGQSRFLSMDSERIQIPTPR